MVDLSQADVQELRGVFQLLDTDGSGSISPAELRHLLRSISVNLTMDELEELVAEVDKDCSGAIEFDEILAILSRDVNPPFSPAEVETSFRMIARNAPRGYIRMKDLEEALRVHLRDVDHYDISELLRAYMDSTVNHPSNPDVDYFNYQAFIDLMMHGLAGQPLNKKKGRPTKQNTRKPSC
ncbi:hypothetical protein FOZ61_009896 [Perkinsus olseni]|uniref:EF-hand domain-containing protein n=1 Tax=Perkinsus olseni TaxID=32597 RepID=A0A7J6KY08_PEROL|nr:hypothetical protein FOZ61_009896 [Perkinsus olseni]KAF4654051.1 hypothetical protein FOL46_008898 [Perkinsus olseni]